MNFKEAFAKMKQGNKVKKRNHYDTVPIRG